MTHIREKLAWALVATLGLFVAASMSGVVSGGPLDPPSPPASSPGGIDGRIPIDHLPFTIDASGSYVVTKNLQLPAGGTGIAVFADDVTVDLNGFTLDGVSSSSTGILTAGRRNLRVINGALRRWSVGVYDADGRGGLFRGLQLDTNGQGVELGTGAVFDANVVHSNTNIGVVAKSGSTITNSTFYDNPRAISAQFGASGILIESNHIGIPAGGIGVGAGDFATIRRNFFSNSALTGYTTIQLSTSNYVVAIENRMKAGLTTGTGGLGLYIPYDITNPLTNLSP